MFSKTEGSEKDAPRASSPTAGSRNSAPSIIGPNLHIIGNLKTEGEIQVDGVIEGDVSPPIRSPSAARHGFPAS